MGKWAYKFIVAPKQDYTEVKAGLKKFNCFASIKTFKQINKNGRNAAPREWSTLTKIDADKNNFKLKHLLVTMLLIKFFNSRCCEVAEHQMFQQFIKLLTSLNFT